MPVFSTNCRRLSEESLKPTPLPPRKQGLLGVVDDLCRGFQISIIRMHGVFPRCAGWHGSQGFINFDAEDIRRQFKKHRPRPSFHRISESDGKVLGNPFDIETGSRPFRDRLDDIHLLDLLERSFQIVAKRMPAAQNHQRRIVQIGVGDAGEAVGKPGAGSQEADTRVFPV